MDWKSLKSLWSEQRQTLVPESTNLFWEKPFIVSRRENTGKWQPCWLGHIPSVCIMLSVNAQCIPSLFATRTAHINGISLSGPSVLFTCWKGYNPKRKEAQSLSTYTRSSLENPERSEGLYMQVQQGAALRHTCADSNWTAKEPEHDTQ